MLRRLFIAPLFLPALCFGQTKDIAGVFKSYAGSKLFVTLNADSTFSYAADQNPVYDRFEDFSENGRWTLSGDTIILNPQLPKKVLVESDFQEQEIPGDTNVTLTFNNIKRYFDKEGNLVKTDTSQFDGVDFVFNHFKRKKQTFVSAGPPPNCTFAGPLHKSIRTTRRTISVKRPADGMKSIFVSFMFVPAGKEFMISNPNSNHLLFNVYTNYYSQQIRQMKLLIKNENVLYTKQKDNGKFEKDMPGSMLKRQRGNS